MIAIRNTALERHDKHDKSLDGCRGQSCEAVKLLPCARAGHLQPSCLEVKLYMASSVMPVVYSNCGYISGFCNGREDDPPRPRALE